MHPMKQQECCRIVLLGAAKARIAKVYSLVQEDPSANAAHRGVTIQFLPCVASFDSYLNEDGERIRYLTKVEYFRNGVELVPDGLLPFVDDDASSAPFDSETAASPSHDKRDTPLFHGISGVAIGAGISAAEDAEKIQVFIETLSRKKVSIAVVQPNSEYASMQEELEAYRTFDVAEKEEAMKHGTIGPAKMAQFAIQFACDIVDKAIEQEEEEERRRQAQQLVTEAEPAAPPKHVPATVPTDMNLELNRYACRKCRTMLFGSDHVEDPPHLPAKHKFSHRKQHGNASDACQSLFLTSNVNWLAASDMGEEVGKLSCPRCMVKVGTWHWSGAQCSCGTWVVPAIQVPVSKVDLVLPPVRRDDPLPLSAVAIIQPAITDKQNVST